jgi:uncharacterized protein
MRDLLQSKLAAVRSKLRQLRVLEEQLKKSLRKCEHELKASSAKHLGSCPVLGEIARRGMRIEILYIAGCPNYSPSPARLRKVLRQEGVSAELSEIEVKDDAAARALNFIGSPTIRVNGLDIEVESRTVNEPAFACRRYAGGAPGEEMIRISGLG